MLVMNLFYRYIIIKENTSSQRHINTLFSMNEFNIRKIFLI